MAEFEGINEYLKKQQDDMMNSSRDSLLLNLPINLSLHELKNLPIDELEKILNCESDRKGNLFPPMAAIIIHELNARREKATKEEIINEIKKATKPHWSTTPNFWLIVLTLIATVGLGLYSILKP